MSTIQVINAKHPSSASNNLVLDSSGNATFAGTAAMSSSFLRNRIINGDMRIDQRNAGASVTPSGNEYTLDRWQYGVDGAPGSRFTLQRNAGSVTTPAGFTNYLGATSTGANVPSSTDRFGLFQSIEGFNVADLDFGLATARTITLSFWVRSSLTGTFGGVVANAAYNRCYVYSYTINAANTWEFKTITIPGDTSGTWLKDNSTGLALSFALAAGASRLAAPGSWLSSAAFAPTGQVNVSATNGATFYVTGVQLEVGSVATPFERRLFGQELMLCQRYFQKSYDLNLALGSIEQIGSVQTSSDATVFYKNFGPIRLMGPMRARPSVTVYNPVTGSTTNPVRNANAGVNIPLVVYDIGQNFFSAFIDNTSVGSGALLQFHYSAFAEL